MEDRIPESGIIVFAEGKMGPGRMVLNERQVSHDPYKRRRGDEGCIPQPESSVV